uniref:Uncharacterized protein n=1 Tax=Arundo donax TaxID=35708 RepID=A0A0A9DGD5_ARUDO
MPSERNTTSERGKLDTGSIRRHCKPISNNFMWQTQINNCWCSSEKFPGWSPGDDLLAHLLAVLVDPALDQPQQAHDLPQVADEVAVGIGVAFSVAVGAGAGTA